MALTQVSRNSILGSMMRIYKHVGIYGGTFDPIHFGHLNTAIEVMEYHQLDEVWFCPAKINPHKLEVQTAPAQDRLQMLELALADVPCFGIVPNELEREGPSYMIDTLRELREEEDQQPYPSQFFLILGDDSLAGFSRWKDPHEIIKIAPPLISRRSLSHSLPEDPKLQEAFRKGETPTKIMEISATQIRDRVKRGLYIGHLVPAKVVDYIYRHGLYL